MDDVQVPIKTIGRHIDLQIHSRHIMFDGNSQRALRVQLSIKAYLIYLM